MNLRKIYLLRIIQIEVYLNFLQGFLLKSRDSKKSESIHKIQDGFFEERKSIRRFLNLIELEKLCQ